VARAAAFKPDPEPPIDDTAEPSFDPKSLSQVSTAEEAQAWAEAKGKSLERGVQKKFQEIAELRKTLEASIAEAQRRKTAPDTWTREDVLKAQNDPTFIAHAQAVLAEQQDSGDEYSALSAEERRRLADIERRQLAEQQARDAAFEQSEHARLAAKYQNYSVDAVNQAMQALRTPGAVKDTMEWIHKAITFEDQVNAAYAMGVKEGQHKAQEKAAAMAYPGAEVVQTPAQRPREGESAQEFLHRRYHEAKQANAAV
jgi:hypothetical protein